MRAKESWLKCQVMRQPCRLIWGISPWNEMHLIGMITCTTDNHGLIIRVEILYDSCCIHFTPIVHFFTAILLENWRNKQFG